MKAIRTAVLILLAAIVGCDEPADELPAKSDVRAVNTRHRAAPPAGVELPAESKTPAGRREVAKAGVGKQGRGYKILKPLGVYFLAKHKLTFEKVKYAVKLYMAEHERFPKSWDEFEKEIIDKNKIKLPELPDGQMYVYDSEKGQLMVEHPPK